MKNIAITFIASLTISLLSRTCIAFQTEEGQPSWQNQQQQLRFAAPSDTPTLSPSISSSPTLTSSPTQQKSPIAPTSSPASSNSTTPAPTVLSNSTSPTSSPSLEPSASPTQPTTSKPTKRYTSDPTVAPASHTTPTSPPTTAQAATKKHGFVHFVLHTLKWILIIACILVAIYYAREYWDEIYYFIMACLHKLSVCCEKVVQKCKQIVTRMIIRMNTARSGVIGDDDDGSMLDGLLMGQRD